MSKAIIISQSRKLPNFNEDILLFLLGEDKPVVGWLKEAHENSEGVKSIWQYLSLNDEGLPDIKEVDSSNVIAWQHLPVLKV